MQNATGGVKDKADSQIIDHVFKTKVYGKKGRRQRAYDRLQAQHNRAKQELAGYEKELTLMEKAKKLTFLEKDQYNSHLQMGTSLSSTIARIEKELATLKPRI